MVPLVSFNVVLGNYQADNLFYQPGNLVSGPVILFIGPESHFI